MYHTISLKLAKKYNFGSYGSEEKKFQKLCLSIFAVIIKQIHIFIALFFQNQSNVQSFSDAVYGVMESGTLQFQIIVKVAISILERYISKNLIVKDLINVQYISKLRFLLHFYALIFEIFEIF